MEIQKAEYKLFENGVKVRLEFIDPALEVYILLPEEKKYRFCGSFEKDDGIFFVKRHSDHRHKVLNAWGISAYVLDMLEPLGLKLIVLNVEDTKEVFEITLEKLKIEATWKYWRDKGYDRQAFIPIPIWTKKK
jgi:hypothetical protein